MNTNVKDRAYKKRPKKLKYGVGFCKDDYRTSNKFTGWYYPYYRAWNSILQRCYSKTLHKKHPTYKTVSVCEDWLNFHKFKDWMEGQNWEGMDLDKDVLSVITGEKVYSPDNCAFISRELNSFFTLRQNHRGDYPLGVTYKKSGRNIKRYIARLNKPDGRVLLGYFHTASEAHSAYQLAKWKYGQELLQQQTDPRIIQAMHVILHNLGNDWAAGRETKTLTI